jgi:hypothetical protein
MEKPQTFLIISSNACLLPAEEENNINAPGNRKKRCVQDENAKKEKRRN